MNPRDSLSVILADIREEAGLQQKDLAAKIGMAACQYSRYECGHPPSLATLGKILAATGYEWEIVKI